MLRRLPPIPELKKKRNNIILKLFILIVVAYFYMSQLGMNLLHAENQIYASDKKTLQNMLAQQPVAGQRHEETEQVVLNSVPDEAIDKINKNLGGELTGYGAVIVRHCRKNQVDPYLLASIIKHETANGTSKAILSLKNPGGIMSPKTGELEAFQTLESGIKRMAEIIKVYYYDEGRTTIEQIGRKYCPVGATNDPGNLNKYWIPTVKKLYAEVSS